MNAGLKQLLKAAERDLESATDSLNRCKSACGWPLHQYVRGNAPIELLGYQKWHDDAIQAVAYAQGMIGVEGGRNG